MSYARGIADRGSSLLQIYLQANFLRSRRRGVCVCMTQVLYALHLLLAKNTLSQKKIIHFHVFVQLSPQIVTLSLRENIAMDLAHVSVLTVSTN